jgi:glycosyltransferase involved in cell wall biosynthesis
MMEAINDAVAPVAPALKPLVLSEVVAKMSLDGKVYRSGDEYILNFEGRVTRMHAEDFAIAARAARRLDTRKLPSNTKSGILSAAIEAHRLVCDEIFRPGAVRVLYFPAETAGSDFYRCLLPKMTLNKGSRVTAVSASAGTPLRSAMDFDTIVYQLAHDEAARRDARELQSAGKKVVYEIDDAFDCLEPWHPRYELYSRPEIQAEVRSMMGIADAVTVTTEWMRDRYAEFTRRIEVIPNYVDLASWPRSRGRNDGIFRVLWAGSASHSGDLAQVSSVLAEFVRAKPDDVRVIFFGDVPSSINLPESSVEIIPFVPFGDYPDMLADIGADVAIAPLADIPFNYAKSPVKLLEYMTTGYPVIASAVGPYNVITNRVNGILAATPGDWMEALEDLYASPALRAEIAANADAFVRGYDIDRNRMAIENFFVSLGRSM